MSKLYALGGGAALVLTVCGVASAQTQFSPVNNAVVNRLALGVGTSFVPLDLTSAPGLNGSVNLGINGYSQAYTGIGGNFSGVLSVEVFGNVGSLGSSLTDVLLVYSFIGNGGNANGAETFDFGVDTSLELDFNKLKLATHGRIDAETSMESGQIDPTNVLNDNVSSNDNWFFNYVTGSAGSTSELGGASAESYSWYVQTTGDVKINFVDVNITDFGTTKIRSMALVINPSQPNLGVPAPGAVLLLSGAGLIAGIRRRR